MQEGWLLFVEFGVKLYSFRLILSVIFEFYTGITEMINSVNFNGKIRVIY